MTTAIVVIVLLAILTMLAFFMNVGATLVTRTRLETMVELGAAGGGRIVAERIATLAGQNVQNGIFLPPSPEDSKHPEKFLTPEQRHWLQSDPSFIDEVKQTAREYVVKNQPARLTDFDAESDRFLTVEYPVAENLCADPTVPKVTINVTAHYTFHSFCYRSRRRRPERQGRL